MNVGNPSSPSRASVPSGTKSSLRRDQREQLLGLLMVLASIALFVAPWVVGYPDSAKDIHRSELAVGLIVFFVALMRFKWHFGMWSDLVVLVAGAWLIASPWLLSLQNTVVFDGAQVFDVAAGIVLVVLAVASMLLLRASRKAGDRQE
ncbi:SPW repeat domain-containing protein [Streptomyces sp. Wb2n-11]|uniref:SPW repeat domain-containing protein n=1 Tax=Streptomyces sp. Wb2n-11 TaxID=1030533 RepID=UPI000A7E5B21|nr:SPW repeat protein [Streptomyces sp. Wb2n-11]